MQVTVAADAKASDSRDIAPFGGWLEVRIDGTLLHLTTRGFFSKVEAKNHVNWLELKAQQLTRQALLPRAVPREKWCLTHISHLSDNTSAVKHANVNVSRSLSLSRLGAEIFDDKERLNLTSSTSHIPGIEQVEADFESRVKSTHSDWMLARSLFRMAVKLLLGGVQVEVDLFADRQNHQVSRCCSYQHDVGSVGTNSLLHPWGDLGVVCACPPPILLGRILSKILQDNVEAALVVAPFWPSQPWFPMLVDMAVDAPLLLPQAQWVTQTPLGEPCWKTQWTLAVWRVSGRKSSGRGTASPIWTAFSTVSPNQEIKRRATRLCDCFSSGHGTTSELTPSVLAKFAPLCYSSA
jgi:hypothetical protein